MMFFAKRTFIINLGKVVFSFGLIFFGLFTMEQAVEPLKESDYFVSWLKSLESTWKGMTTGAIVTVVVQSSSATLGMVIGLAGQNLITITAAIAVMLGAELGTCADTLVASIGRSRAAIKTGLFHLLFNVTTIIIGMIFLPYFTQLVLYISNGMSLSQTVANAHMLFNGLGVLVMLPLLSLYEKVLNNAVPDKINAQTGFTVQQVN
jgi:phosphate:Na+ symporter